MLNDPKPTSNRKAICFDPKLNLYLLNFKIRRISREAIVNLMPALKNGGSVNIETLIASHVVPQMIQIKMYPRVILIPPFRGLG